MLTAAFIASSERVGAETRRGRCDHRPRFGEAGASNRGMSRWVRVVIVEDNDLLRTEMIRSLSEKEGIDVVGSCSDGATAVDLVLQKRPDVVVMDLRLPRLDGCEATRRILQAWPEARILIHTGSTASSQARDVLAMGAHAVVFKSTNPDRLVQALRLATADQPVSDG